VPFCALAQGIRAQGIVRNYPAVVTPVISCLSEHNVNIHQMPCPELCFDRLIRRPKQKSAYADERCQLGYASAANLVTAQVEMYMSNGYEVVAIMGIEFSPSCAVSLITGPPPKRIQPGQGFFIEALSHALRAKGKNIPFIGIKTSKPEDAVRELRILLKEEG